MLTQVLLAVIPIAWLIIAMTLLKMSGVKACGIGLVITAAECLIVYKMGALEVATGAAEGAIAALWPICIIIVAAMFTYNMSLHTGAMEIIKGMLGSVSNDKRIVALILGWGFSNFMEGIAGFGTAVAIPAAMMVGLGFDPISAAVICLIGNAASPAFGAIGTPTISAANTAGLDPNLLSEPTAFLLMILNLISPFIIIYLVGGSWKALKGVLPITIVSAVSFYAVARFVGPELSVVVGSLVTLICIILMGRNAKEDIPEEYLLTKPSERSSGAAGTGSSEAAAAKMSVAAAWLPYILILVFLLGASKLVPPVNAFLGQFKSSLMVYSGENPATLSLSWINTPGVLMIIAAVIGSAIQGASASDMLRVMKKTFQGYWKAMLTVVFIVAIAKLMGYAGMVLSLANGLVAMTGNVYPLIAPIIGGIGCFVTGSATSACIMFANLQNEVATQLGVDPYWLVAANSAGATAGKMISPQSIAVAADFGDGPFVSVPLIHETI
ncbi:MAG: L-lactate permease, partial [Lachnospiraceae bacterium]|nr:L-lactate permease [Lachnospiraceae bacterium]